MKISDLSDKHQISEYGMSSGSPTPVSQQQTGDQAKSSVAASTSKSPTMKGSQSNLNKASQSPTMSNNTSKQTEPVIAKASELEQDFEYPDSQGNLMKVVTPVDGKNKAGVVVQNTRTKEIYTLDPNDKIAMPQLDQSDIKTENSSALKKLKSRRHHLKTGKKGHRTIELGRRIKQVRKMLRKHRHSLGEQNPVNQETQAESIFRKISKLNLSEQLLAIQSVDQNTLEEAWQHSVKILQEGVPDHSAPREIQHLLNKPLLGNDIRSQMEAYFAIPDPSMIKAFRQARAEGGDAVDLRPIFKSFIQQKAHPKVKQQAGLTESIMSESKGIMGRVTGDKFTKGDQQLEFQGVTVYPEDNQQFESSDQRDAAVAEFEKQLGTKIQWSNNPNKGTLAFGIATLTDPLSNDKPTYWGRYFKAKMVNMMGAWDNSQVPSGWKLQKAGSLKLDIGIDPQSLIKSENLHGSIDDIINTVAANSQGHEIQAELIGGLNQIKSKQNPVFEGSIQHLPALRDYFGEIMGPCALMAGMVKGQAEDANRQLLKGIGWDKCKVFWPQSMNYALVDSVFVGLNGEEVGVSSKGGKGARASAKNIADVINKAPPNLVKKYKTTVNIIKIVEAESALNAPFRLAELLGILPLGLEKEISTYVKTGKTDYEKLSKNAKELFKYGTPRQDVPGFNTGYALLALLAKKVAVEVNKKPEFSDGCIAFLNQSSIVQIYCKMGKQGDDARVTGWDAVYPPNFQGRVVLDGSKNYYSSRIGGKFAFGFV